MIYEQRVSTGEQRVYLDELLGQQPPQQEVLPVQVLVETPLGGIGDTALEPFTSEVCLDFIETNLICIPWFSVDWWQQILDYRNVLRLETWET